MTTHPIDEALNLPNGTRWVKCALQVNPYGYAEQYRGESSNMSKEEYNLAMAQQCKQHGIEVVGITHHNNVDDVDALRTVLQEHGVTVFPGFEVASSEGVHVLCLFEPGTDCATLNRYLGELGVHDTKSSSVLSSKTFQEILKIVRNHNGMAIAAHTSNAGGLFKVLSGQARINAWKDKDLLAIQIPGAINDLPPDVLQIVQNKNADYRRPSPPAPDLALAVINAADVKQPDDLAKVSATSRIKMAALSIEGLRQAFLDPESRIELNSTAAAERATVQIEAMAWGGGFLADQALHFNAGLNVLIGGRGTGKSTVIESLRYALGLEPLGEEAKQAHHQIVKSVLGSGARIWVRLKVSKPSPRIYLIERGVHERPVVKSERGEVLSLSPTDVVADLQIYGQHEIAELTRDTVRQTALIRRFVTSKNDFAARKESLLRALKKNRQSLVQAQADKDLVDEKLAALPGIEDTLKSFKDAGLEDKLKHQSLLVREEGYLKRLVDKLEPFEEVSLALSQALPIDMALVSDNALKDLPHQTLLGRGRDVLVQLEQSAQQTRTQLSDALNTAKQAIADMRQAWEVEKAQSNQAYENTLRELHREKIDGTEFVRLRQRIEELQPLKGTREQLHTQIQALMDERRHLLQEWDEVLSQEFLELEQAAKSASRKLREQVKLAVVRNGDRKPLIDFLESNMTGRKDQIRRAVEQPNFSLRDFSQAVMDGPARLQLDFGISAAQAEGLGQLGLDTRLALAEIELQTTTEVSLNVASENQGADWKRLQDLSKGQKATALLLLLLLDSTSPLIVDQPEDDLDNRFVTTGVVPRIRTSKKQRQFVFATHNANIPVLGDAELIAVLSANGEAGMGQCQLDPRTMGAIDTPEVKKLVEDLLEGGHTAFEARRNKYHF